MGRVTVTAKFINTHNIVDVERGFMHESEV